MISKNQRRRFRRQRGARIEQLEERRVLDSTVAFNEVMYNPVGEESHEWIELHNQMSVDVELSQWTIEGAVDYEFPAGTILPGGAYLVVASDPQAVTTAYGLEDVLGPFNGRLSNQGERIELRNHTQRLMNTLVYEDGLVGDDLWPAGADGTGATLAKSGSQSASEDPTNWVASEQIGGTPGSRNFLHVGDVQRQFFVEMDAEWNYDQSGRDLGTAWREPGFDDSDWLSGKSLLYVDNSALPEEKNTLLELGPTTYYFRTTFEFDGDPSHGSLRMEHVVDDGAIFYLNGQEIERFRLPEGTVTSSTVASRVGTARSNFTDAIDTSALRVGTNTLAVEVHQQSATSDDIALGAKLWLVQQVAPPAIPWHDVMFTEVSAAGQDTWIEISNTSDLPISMAGWKVADTSGHSHTLPTQVLAANSSYVVTAADAGWQPTEGDRLFLVDDASGRLIDAVRVADRGRGRVAHLDDRWQYVSTPSPGADNQFDFHDEVVINEIMYNSRPTYAEPAVLEFDAVIPFDSEWRFQYADVDLGVEFANPGFDDSSWNVGTGVFFREDSELNWTKNTPLAIGHVTTYFRQQFENNDADASYAIELMIDDGAVVYLNGHEVLRLNLPAGGLTADTLANPSVSNASIRNPIVLPSELLNVGVNTLAVELHQNSAYSPDAVFGMQVLAAEEIVPAKEFVESHEEWIELYNRSDVAVDLSDWQLNDAIEFTMPPNTTLSPGEHVVVAGNADELAIKYPAVRILGEYKGSLSNYSERIQLLDDAQNLADEVHYFEGGYWPEFADGGGASLELTDPDADNSHAGAWQQSDESQRTEWQHVSYTTSLTPIVHDPPIHFQELVIGLLDSGEVLIDNISVKEIGPDGEIELIQNGDFESDLPSGPASKWRAVGTHNRTDVIVDPDDANNQLMRLRAVARMNYLSNHVETTLANGAVVENGKTYQISYDARWVAGTPQLHTELYYKDAARTTVLKQPDQTGTPGSVNTAIRGSLAEANTGPTYEGLRHEPVIPDENQPVVVSVNAHDNDGIRQIQAFYRVDDTEDVFQAVPMQLASDGQYRAELPPQVDESLVQFYVRAEDERGAVSFYPPAGPESRALYRVQASAIEDPLRQSFEVLTLKADADRLHTNIYMVDNQHLGATLIHQGAEAFYDAGVRLRGSMFSRQNKASTGYNIKFRPEQLFRGVHDSIAFDQGGEEEIIVKFINLQSGNGGGTYDDVFNVVTPSGAGGGPTLVYLARHSGLYLEEQFGVDPGTLFKFEGIRVLTSTSDRDDPESLKVYQPIGWVPTFDIEDLGNDKELYRWPFLINGNRAEDDYSGIIRLAKAFSAPDDQLEQAVAEVMDMDSWTKTFALMSLFGIGDAYTQGNPHNLNIFVPSNGDPIQAFPWDWDFVFNRGATTPLHGAKNMGKILDIPTYEHLFLGHMNHLMETVFNFDYIERWHDHFDKMLGGAFPNRASAVQNRIDFVTSEFPNRFPFIAGFTGVDLVERKVLTEESPTSILIPSIENGGDQLGNDWTEPDFVESDTWSQGSAAVGFQPDTTDRFTPYIKTPLPDMRDNSASVFLRIPFQLDDIPDETSVVQLRMRYDDGFVASLNGVRVAAANEPDEITWDADATRAHRNDDAVEFQAFDITEFRHLLVPGENLLAIQGMNTTARNSDALFGAEVVIVDVVDNAPPGAMVTDQSSINVEGIGWIDIREIRLKGDEQPLPVRWTSSSEWETSVALQPGTNTIELEAYDFDGELIGSQALTVVSTASRPEAEFLRISELMYHPVEPSAAEQLAGFANDRDFEFVELVNTSQGDLAVALSLDQFTLSGGIDFQFPDVSLAPGERIVVAANPLALELRYGDVGQVLGPYDGALANGGDQIVLTDNLGVTLLDVAYDDAGLWPVRADGVGASLVARDPTGAVDQLREHHQWRGSTEFGGSPGAAAAAELGIVVNEVTARTATPRHDAIELYNRSSQPIDLSGWYLSDADDDLLKYALADGTVLAADQYLVIEEPQFHPTADAPGPKDFALNGVNGDSVWLVVSDGNGGISAFADEVHFSGSRESESLGRIPNGSGSLATFASPSLGTANTDPRVAAVAISEVHYQPVQPSAAALAIDPAMTVDDLEYVELTNTTVTTVDLTDWRLRGGIQMNFDAGTQLAAGEALVVISFNPVTNANRAAAFRAEYEIPATTRLVGGFSGGLNNGADHVQLLAADPTGGEVARPLEDAIIYDDRAPWPTAADGAGSSLTRTRPDQWGTLVNAWAAALPSPGTVSEFSVRGDLNGDRAVNAADIDRLCGQLRAGDGPRSSDLNGDNQVDEADLTTLVEGILGTTAGDADLNGRFDSEDIVAVFIAGQYNDDLADNSTWATGDWNCDGDFDNEDVVAAFIAGDYQP